jgi:hypothetical protein
VLDPLIPPLRQMVWPIARSDKICCTKPLRGSALI